jgi:hypothetical protein
MCETVQNFVEKHHPNKAVAARAMNIFNDNAMSHFREILKWRQKQQLFGSFFVKVAGKDSSEPTGDSDPLLLNNKTFSSSNLYRLPHCTGTAMYIYCVQGPEYFVLIIL